MIKNIIFDLGGVILNIDYNKTSEAFRDLGLIDFDNLYSQSEQSHLFDKFEKGLISENDFRENIRIFSKINLTDFQIDSAWNAMLLDLPAERIQILMTAKKNYRTFLLSNTNIIHLRSYTENLYKKHNIKSLSELFEKEFFSHEIHLRKPDIESFNYLIKSADIDRKETLFIDDSIQHIEGAKIAQLHTFFIDKNRNLDLSNLFENGKLKSIYE
ncbi:MAG: hypothetical protein AUJ98_07785 [Bacteroidetes bacterium CG2_30_33_31]|nr:MAG: hypothetical protein AUJ98_07785 [Bacteroidetes bacterium CG2_30_33_31]